MNPLVIKDYQKKYKSTTISPPNLEIKEKVILLIGSNGSGKTTLLKSLAAIIQFEGSIDINSSKMYSEEISRFPEDMTLNQYLETLLKLSKTSHLKKNQLLERFDLEMKKEAALKTLSKGMKQKVNLIQALMEEKSVYLLDEPLSGLDAVAQKTLINIIQESDKQFICSTHNIDAFKPLNPRKIYL